MASIKTNHIFSLLIFLIILNSTVNEARNVLYSGETLKAGEFLSYKNYTLKCQADCNLVLYLGDEFIWATNTGGKGRDCNCKMQTDGNLVVRKPNWTVIWSSNSCGSIADYALILQEDRNVVIYGPARWSTNTQKCQNIVPITSGVVGNRNGGDPALTSGVAVSPSMGTETCPVDNSKEKTE